MAPSIAALDARWYPGVADNWDDRMFAERARRLLRPTDRLLDVGAGAGIIPLLDFRGAAREVVGIDVDPRVSSNPHLHHHHVGPAERIPEPDESFDVVLCDNVLEHLENPAVVFREVRRVLKPGGIWLAKTPNRRHYVAAAARLTPLCFHRAYNRMRGREAADTFRTHYRANSPSALRKLALDAGLEAVSIDLVEGRPEYLRVHPLGYLLGMLYERAVNRLDMLRGFRVVLIAELRRPTSSPTVEATGNP